MTTTAEETKNELGCFVTMAVTFLGIIAGSTFGISMTLSTKLERIAIAIEKLENKQKLEKSDISPDTEASRQP